MNADASPVNKGGMPKPRLRLRTAQRSQLEWRSVDLDACLAAEHPARALWAALERLDLSGFYEGIKTAEDEPGRDATDPRILLCLWLYATADGVGSAREIERLTHSCDPYRWICGGVSVSHTILSEFRAERGAPLDKLMTQLLGVLMLDKLITLKQVAQDGMRVRASAGASSFRRAVALKDCLWRARHQIETLKAEIDADPSANVTRRQEHQKHVAEQQRARIERALSQLEQVQRTKESNREKQSPTGTGEARVSTTDPDARVMKMADGGFRPAYNVQFATDVDSRVIVGVGVTNIGSDMSQMIPMLDDILARMGRLPGEQLVDGGYANTAQIKAAAQRGVTVLAPIKRPRRGQPPREVRPNDEPEIAQWLRRMQTRQARFEYRKRAAIAEPTNARARQTGLGPLLVRGLPHVRNVVLLTALSLNLQTWMRLKPN